MTETGWETTIKGLRQQLASIKNHALADSTRFDELRRQVESTKIQFLASQLETRRKHLARSRGVTSLVKHEKDFPFWMAAGITAVAGMITKDWLAAGVAGANGALRGLGETEWAVCLGTELAVAPRDSVRQGEHWVTWESLMTALDELAVWAKDESLGNLDNIITELLKNENIVFVTPPPTGGANV